MLLKYNDCGIFRILYKTLTYLYIVQSIQIFNKSFYQKIIEEDLN